MRTPTCQAKTYIRNNEQSTSFTTLYTINAVINRPSTYETAFLITS